jgi:hypothetical protein
MAFGRPVSNDCRYSVTVNNSALNACIRFSA